MTNLLRKQSYFFYASIAFFGSLVSFMTIMMMHHLGVSYLQSDSGKYINPALGLLSGHGYGTLHQGMFYPELERLPGYPLFISFVYLLFGIHNELAVVLVQTILMGGLVPAIALIVRTIDKRYAWVAAVFTILCPNLFFRAATILPDLLFTFFISWGLCFLFYSLRKRFWTFYILSSCCFGLALMTRPAFLLYPVMTFPFLMFLLKDRLSVNLWRSVLLSLFSLVIMALILSPQLVREHHLTGKYMITNQGAYHSLFWLYPCLKTKWGAKRDMAALNQVQIEYSKQLNKLAPEERKNTALVNAMSTDLALKLIRSIPLKNLVTSVSGSSLKLLFYSSALGISETFEFSLAHAPISLSYLKKTFNHLSENPSIIFILTSQLMLFLLRIIQCLGIFYGLYHHKFRLMTLYLLSGAVSFIIISVGIGNPRYRAPIEPVLLLFLIFGLMAISHYWKNKLLRK